MNVERERFEHAVLPHLDAAYNLARRLTRNDHEVSDLNRNELADLVRLPKSSGS